MKLYALLGIGLLGATLSQATTIGYTVDVDDDQLYTIDLVAGTRSAVGPTGVGTVRGLSFDPTNGTLYGVDQSGDNLLTFNTTTGAATTVGSLGVDGIGGLAFNGAGDLFFAQEFDEILYSVDKSSGVATAIGSFASSVTALDFSPMGALVGYSDTPDNQLVTINTATGASTAIGASGISATDAGIAFDSSGTLWGVFSSGQVATLSTSTGAATVEHAGLGRLSSLAIQRTAAVVPEPGSIGLWSMLVCGLVGFRRRQRLKS